MVALGRCTVTLSLYGDLLGRSMETLGSYTYGDLWSLHGDLRFPHGDL